MTPRSRQSASDEDEAPELTIPLQSVCRLIVKAREYDVKDVNTDPDSGSNESDDNMVSVLEDRGDDPVGQEMRAFISSLSDDEQIDLIALAWLGRDDNTPEDWPSIRAEAARAHANHRRQTAKYLMGEPLLGDYLEEGLSLLGKSCEDAEL